MHKFVYGNIFVLLYCQTGKRNFSGGFLCALLTDSVSAVNPAEFESTTAAT